MYGIRVGPSLADSNPRSIHELFTPGTVIVSENKPGPEGFSSNFIQSLVLRVFQTRLNFHTILMAYLTFKG